jgi:DNA-directed RNA polymerase sigma subunit (sigma70/sigma32)
MAGVRKEVLKLVSTAKTHQEIADKVGVSRQRVTQILEQEGASLAPRHCKVCGA